jgi:2-hydroxychromene-2-carboxylate isomerase
MITVEFHFDFGSPNAYLSHLAIPRVEARTRVKFEYIPVLLGGVFKATNNVSPAISLQGIKNKPEYSQIETARFLRFNGVEGYQSNPHFPVNTLQIMRGAVFAKTTDFFEKYVDEVYRHMWREPKKMDEADVIKSALTESELPAEEILTGIQNSEVKQALINNTQNSIDRGTFGSPTFYVGTEIFFGKDKLRDVEEEILRTRSAM